MFLPWQKLCLHWISTFLNNTCGIFPIKFYDKSWFITNLSIKNQLKFIKFCSSKYFFRRYLHWKFSGTLAIYEFHRAKLVISYDFTILSFFFFFLVQERTWFMQNFCSNKKFRLIFLMSPQFFFLTKYFSILNWRLVLCSVI